jgi:penicillin-binding protein 2
VKNDIYNNRKFIISALVTTIVTIYLVQLFILQIVNYNKYFDIAGNNALLKKTIFPTRGLLFDRNGKLLVYNRAAYDVLITMKEVKTFDTLDFCRIVNITPEHLRERISEITDRETNRGYSPYVPQVLINQLSEEENGALQEKLYKFPGFELRNHTLREYASPYAAHVLGTTGEVSQKAIDEDDYYSRGDFAGKDGIELSYEDTLRGEKGVSILLRDSRGRIKGKYEKGKFDKYPTAGKDLTLTIDFDLQAYGEKLLQGKIGSVVAIEPETGEILAMVSTPTYDPSLLLGRQRSENYKKLLLDPSKPLLNRATQAQYSPGSTFKPLQALVCLQQGGITENSIFPCNGPRTSPIKCTHSHGSPVTLVGAIEQSCNPYFWNTFRSTLEKDGYGQGNENFKKNFVIWRNNVLSFGYGKKFDTDIKEQVRGNVPSEEFFNKMFGAKGWRAMTIRSLSIGQGEVLATPLQMANLAATIANRGYYVNPHLARIKKIATKHYTNVDRKYFDVVVQGMLQVCESGTASAYKIKDISVCGKTGTVQNNHGKDHSIFIGFAPQDHPKIAIAVVIENAGFGATWAYPISSLMIEMYLNKKIDENRLYLEEKMKNSNFIINAQPD